jgi:hypothetical protein
MLLSDYFLKKFVKDQYEKMSMEPPVEREPEPRYSMNAMSDADRKFFDEQKKKLDERLGTSWYEESSKLINKQQSVITQAQTQSKGKSMSIK